jgi:1,4-dihydroxy-6-naphthoate synthase
MLLQLFAPGWKDIVILRFDRIMDAIESGQVDCGVIIHESRFTYQARGLKLVVDLGAWWEEISGYPIPLGGIAARRTLGTDLIASIDRAVKASIGWARNNPGLCSPYIKKYAQELDDTIISQHIGLYVNPFTEELGREGRGAVEYFLQKGAEAGIFPEPAHRPLTVKK